jgi:hypothetical protein
MVAGPGAHFRGTLRSMETGPGPYGKEEGRPRSGRGVCTASV